MTNGEQSVMKDLVYLMLHWLAINWGSGLRILTLDNLSKILIS